MKRLIIEGDVERHGPKPDGDRWVVMDGEGIHAAWIRDDCPRVRITVEDVPDPLPTEPGVRFWGETTCAAPQWWFVLKSGEYAPMSGDSAHGPDECDLRRLPDPEEAP